MIHLLLIDPLKKLDLAKDSTMLLAATLQAAGEEAYFLFEKDFYFTNGKVAPVFSVYHFCARLRPDSFYLESVELKQRRDLRLSEECCLHMRLDPPFDTRYLRFLWMLAGLSKCFGVRVLNDPVGILANNEKMCAYQTPFSVESFVGSSPAGFLEFVRKQQKRGLSELILKPLDLFQGMGVEKLSLSLRTEQLGQHFEEKVGECGGAIVAQPFLSEIQKGEVRSIFFADKHLGSILKTPPPGEFLANIARGADYAAYTLPPSCQQRCLEICSELAGHGVLWVAFDLVGERVQEVNVTCPGLLVEVSEALGRNLASELLTHLQSFLDNK